MPNRDGTGPEGKGTKTGRGLGNCVTEKSSDETIKSGRGLGKRLGNRKGSKNRRRNRVK